MIFLNIEISGINVNYIKEGRGDPILLLHGWGSNIILFKQLINDLSDSYTVYALDMPGFGETDELKKPWCVDDYADFVIEFIKILGLDNFAILGHSFGGRVIIKINHRTDIPFKISKIILVDSAGIMPKKTFKKKIRQRLYKISKAILSVPAVLKIFPNAVENLRKKNGSEDYNNATPVMRQTLVKVVNEDLEPYINEIKVPTLLIWGENDTATPLSDGKRMEELIKDSGLVLVKNAGHYSYLENPYLVSKVLHSFLGS